MGAESKKRHGNWFPVPPITPLLEARARTVVSPSGYTPILNGLKSVPMS